MNRRRTRWVIGCALVILAGAVSARFGLQPGARRITVDYPFEDSVFPPEFPAPTFLWRDAARNATAWTVDVTLAGGASLHATSQGEPMRLGEIDPRCVSETNEPPKLTPEQAAAHTWIPDSATWEELKKNSTRQAAIITITGYRDASFRRAVSRGRVTIRTSTDPVAAPIFYRDVPLMPSETEKGVIKPLATQFTPLIAWRLRNVAETRSRVVMEGIYSCANCHSVSRDGQTMGMDVDGPRNDKGLYALFPIKPQSAIRHENVIAWSTYRGKLGGKLRVGFMSQVSPAGEYVVTTIMDPGKGQTDYERQQNPADLLQNYYVANFKDYRFLQVFFPTRGILAWYSKATGRLQPLPGADDPRYVHTNGVWTPDGKYLVFARAEARDAYPPGAAMADRANDPNETQIQYDLYRIPFNGGKGGRPEPVAGASRNGKSNSFPKVSPDGRWIVYVQARNGQLMRPDSELYIVPAEGGQARRLRSNTPLMNSWHSFSPNGRWLVFSSKSRSPYTQMFLTHVDAAGDATPAILIENSTAANRAVNIPEFVNIPPDGLVKIEAPVADYYRLINVGSDALNKGQYDTAVSSFRKALEMQPGEAQVHNSLGNALTAAGKPSEAIGQYRKAAQISPEFPDAHNNLGSALATGGKTREAIAEFKKALALNPEYAEAHTSLGGLLAQQGQIEEAISHLQEAVTYKPAYAMAHSNLGLALAQAGRVEEAVAHGEQAVKLSGGHDPLILEFLSGLYARTGRFGDAAQALRQALEIAIQAHDVQLADQWKPRLAEYEARRLK